MSDKEEEKKDFWLITVQHETLYKVVFEEPLTMTEAMNAFDAGDFYDIIDEEVVSDELIVEIK